MNRTFCDRCGTQAASQASNGPWHKITVHAHGSSVDASYDLCGSCGPNLERWLKGVASTSELPS